jgi:hypothetical protein
MFSLPTFHLFNARIQANMDRRISKNCLEMTTKIQACSLGPSLAAATVSSPHPHILLAARSEGRACLTQQRSIRCTVKKRTESAEEQDARTRPLLGEPSWDDDGDPRVLARPVARRLGPYPRCGGLASPPRAEIPACSTASSTAASTPTPAAGASFPLSRRRCSAVPCS